MAANAHRNTSAPTRRSASRNAASRRHSLRIESLESRLTMSADLANSIAAARVFGTGATIAGRIGDGVLGSRDVDIVGFSVRSGGRLTVDIDARTLPRGSTLDSVLRVFTASGRTVASNDDFGGSLDSYLSFTVPSAGTYYVGVSGWGNSAYNPLVAGGGRAGSTGVYSLTVSIANPQPVDRSTFATPEYRPTTGWGFVDAAAAVSRMRGHGRPLPAVADLGGNEVGNDLVNAPEAWDQGYTGAGVVVAVVDTGVDYHHDDLYRNIWVNPREIADDGIDNDRNGFVDDVRGWDFVNHDAAPMDVVDTSRDWLGNRGNPGHGTHVAGTIAAARNGIGSTGVAPDARIMPVRVLDHRGDGTSSAIARGVRYAADNGAHVINMSLGGGPASSEVEQAIRHAVSRGCVVVIAAGNDGESTPMFPAHLAATIDGVIAVGAANGDRTLAHLSHKAGTDRRMQYVTALGVGVHSTLPGNRYGSQTGTSMAAPHVAGVVALMRSALPASGQERYWTHLTGTARQLPATTATVRVAVTPVTASMPGRLAAFAAVAAEPGLAAGPRTPVRVAFATRA